MTPNTKNNNADPFAGFSFIGEEVAEQPPSRIVTPTIASPAADDPFASFSFAGESPVEKEVTIESAQIGEGAPHIAPGAALTPETTRQVTRGISRAGEAIGGLFGDIAQLPGMAMRGIAGAISPEFGQEVKKAQQAEMAGFQVPTSQDLRNVTESLTGDYLVPQSEKEEIADEIISTAAVLGGGGGSGAMKIFNPLLKAIGGQAVKEGLKWGGFSPIVQDIGKLGAITIGGLFNLRKLKEIPGKLYKARDASYKPGTLIDAKKFSEEALKLEKQLLKGGYDPAKSEALRKAKEFQQAVSKGMEKSLDDFMKQGMSRKEAIKAIRKQGPVVELEELIEFQKSINGIKKSKGFLEQIKPTQKKMAFNIDRADNVIKDSLKEYGKVNPKFYDLHQKAQSAYAALAKSNKMKNMIEESLIKYPKLAGIISRPLSIVLKGIAPVTAGKGFYELMKSGEMRKGFAKVLVNAARDDVKVMSNEMSKLEKRLEKEGI